MNRISRIVVFTFLISLGLVLVAQSGNTDKSKDSFKLNLPKREDPILLSTEKYPPEKWWAKTESVKREQYHWFPSTVGGWYLDWDCERQPVKSLVIHHTAMDSTTPIETISKGEIERLYKPVYRNKNYKTPYIFGLPIHSGHVIKGKETFFPYHHLIYPDGKLVTYLTPYQKIKEVYYVDMIGWHAGDWRTNCESIAIALAGDYSTKKISDLPKPMLKTLNQLVRYYKKLIPDIKVLAHSEIVNRDCPGGWFNEWKQSLK